jgi:hypothetical protein
LSVRENVFKLYNLYKSVHERHQVAETTVAPTRQSSSQVQTIDAPSIFARKDAYNDILTWWKQNCT